MKTIYFYILLMFSLTLLFPACECEDLAPTIPTDFGEPDSDPFLIINFNSDSGQDFFFSSFEFNKEIDIETFIFNESIIADQLLDNDNTSPSIEQFSDTEIGMSGVIDCDMGEFFICPDTVFVTFKGTGSSVIRALDGQILEGDQIIAVPIF